MTIIYHQKPEHSPASLTKIACLLSFVLLLLLTACSEQKETTEAEKDSTQTAQPFAQYERAKTAAEDAVTELEAQTQAIDKLIKDE